MFDMEANTNNISMYAAIAAEMAIQPIALDLQRKYLDENSGLELRIVGGAPCEDNIQWLKITQIGRPVDKAPEVCFSSIQKILETCYMPGKQLIFLIEGKSGVYTLFLGVKTSIGNPIDIQSFGEFIKGRWNGIACEPIDGDNNATLKRYKNDLKEMQVCALTGVPSLKTNYDSYHTSSIDGLLTGMLNKDFYYLVIAEPVERQDIDSVLSSIRTISGSLESLKTLSYSKNTGSSEQANQLLRDDLSKEEQREVGWGFLKKTIPFYGTFNSAKIEKELQQYYTPSTTYSTSETVNVSIVDKHVDSAIQYLDKQSQRYQICEAMGAWRTGIYIMSSDSVTTESASSQVRSLVSGTDSYYEPIRIHKLNIGGEYKDTYFMNFDNPEVRIVSDGEVYHNGVSKVLDDLMTVLSTEELSYFVNFPHKSVPGISVVDSCPDFNLNKIEGENNIPFGSLLFGASETQLKYSIDTQILTRHALVAGINGSGKTNTIQSILKGIVGKQEQIPFLIIEPAKTEYVDWAIKYNEEAVQNGKELINIFVPGCKKYRNGFIPEKLSINPFEIVWLSEEQEPNILAHIDRLKSVFASAFPMTDILPVLMEDLIYSIYQVDSTNWIGKEANPKYNYTRFPTLNSMSYYVDKVMAKHKYEEKVQMNMEACLNTRVDSLKRGWRGELLNNERSTEWSKLFEKPTVINLSYVGDDLDKAFIMSLILQFLYEYRTAKAELGEVDMNSNDCSHLTIIEEAHRVMSKCENQELPQYKSAMLFSNMLSEIRAYGESMFLVDQVPTRLIPDALKNTNLKIVHRLVAEDDCKAMSEAMGLNDEQRKMIQKLLTGQCIVSSSSDTNAYWVKVNKVK